MTAEAAVADLNSQVWFAVHGHHGCVSGGSVCMCVCVPEQGGMELEMSVELSIARV